MFPFSMIFPDGKVDICWFQLLIFLKMPEQEKKAYKTRTARQDCMLIWICLAGGKWHLRSLFMSCKGSNGGSYWGVMMVTTHHPEREVEARDSNKKP